MAEALHYKKVGTRYADEWCEFCVPVTLMKEKDLNLAISARHMKLTEALESYAREKLEAPVARILDKSGERMRVEFHSEHNTFTCHVTLSAPKIETLSVSEEADDLYAAIDKVHHTLTYQLKRRLARHSAA